MKGSLREVCEAALEKHTALLEKAQNRYDTANQWIEASSFMKAENVFATTLLERANARDEINMYKNYIKVTSWFLDIVENSDNITVDTARFKGDHDV